MAALSDHKSSESGHSDPEKTANVNGHGAGAIPPNYSQTNGLDDLPPDPDEGLSEAEKAKIVCFALPSIPLWRRNLISKLEV